MRADAAVALGDYDGLLRQLILRMKRPTGDRISLAIGELMWEHCQERLQAAAADLVAPIPMYWLRRAHRGTNSPLLIAEVLAGRLGVPLEPRLLRRRRNTLPQSGLLPTQRIRNLQGALAVRSGYALQGARVLLVDDIMTTGATCTVAARSLNAAGAGAVIAAVVARSPSSAEPVPKDGLGLASAAGPGRMEVKVQRPIQSAKPATAGLPRVDDRG